MLTALTIHHGGSGMNKPANVMVSYKSGSMSGHARCHREFRFDENLEAQSAAQLVVT